MGKVFVTAAVAAVLVTETAFAACGAIAFNPNTNQWGRSWGYDTLGDAMNAAIGACNNGCGIYTWTCSADTVVAIVFSADHAWATNSGPTYTDAINNARAICNGNCDGYVTTANQ